jgi:hypothetical protein
MSRYYICIRGRKPGIFYTTWDKFERLIYRYKNAKHFAKDTEIDAIFIWTINRHLVSDEYFMANYHELYPDMKLVEIIDYGVKKNILKNDEIVNEDNNNLNFTFRNDNSGDSNSNNDGNINNLGDDNNNNPIRSFNNSRNYNISNDVDNNLPHFGGTNSMNSRIIINDALNSSNIISNSPKNNIRSLCCRNVIDNRLGPTQRSGEDKDDDDDKNVNNFYFSNINSLSCRNVNDKELGPNEKSGVDKDSNDIRKVNNLDKVKSSDNYSQKNIPTTLLAKHCDSIYFEGYDPTMILDAMDAIVNKIKEMLK